MKPIQIFLLIALIIIFSAYFRRFRSALMDKIFVGTLFLCGTVFVIDPDLSTKISAFIGVGRGVDLIFYIAIVSFCYLFLIMYSKLKALEEQVTALIRNQAIGQAENNLAGEEKPISN